MRQHLGETRSSVRARHALISPDSHERTTLPGWPGSAIVIVISRQIGAGFTQYFVELPPDGTGGSQGAGIERFFFVLDGCVTVTVGRDSHELSREDYSFLPADQESSIRSAGGARLVVFERAYVPLAGTRGPDLLVNSVRNVPITALKDDERLPLQKLLPENLSFDFEVNIMGFTPGASLHYVETHFMEHGLLMLDGGGIYRLDTSWYSTCAGDAIWMGPFCPQWFGAIGRTNARYLIYKNWNRMPVL